MVPYYFPSTLQRTANASSFYCTLKLPTTATFTAINWCRAVGRCGTLFCTQGVVGKDDHRLSSPTR